MNRDLTTKIEEIKRRALVVTVVGALIGGGLPALLGIVAVLTAENNPSHAEKLTSIAWLIMIVVWLTLAAFLLMVALGAITVGE